jgi:hypothetical protein
LLLALISLPTVPGMLGVHRLQAVAAPRPSYQAKLLCAWLQ